jgi:PAS domain S-box-containing protein
VPGALPFAIGCLLAGLTVIGAGMEAAATDLESKIAWFSFSLAWHLPAVTVMACFVLEYVWPGRWITRRTLLLLSIVPLLALPFLVNETLRSQAWVSFQMDGVFAPDPGPIVWAFILYAHALSVVEVIAFAWLFRRSPPHRLPVAIMLAGLVGARVLYLLDVTGAVSSSLPLDVLLIAYLYLMYAIALFGFRILDPVPFARQTVIEQMRGGILVLDPQGRVVGANPAAQAILGSQETTLLGRNVQEALPVVNGAPAGAVGSREEPAEIRRGAEPDLRTYEVESSPLRDWRGVEIGSLLLLHDVTEQRQAQVHLIEQQRALAMLHERERLARELHDGVGQIFAFVNTQGQTIRRMLSRGDVAAADACVGRLVDVAREADADVRESILALHISLSERALFPALDRYLLQYEKNFGIHVQIERPTSVTDSVFEPQVAVQLLRILQEALTNVRKHAGAHCVQITLVWADSGVRITVCDDGQGFDLAKPGESAGGHIGLRVMRERAESVGGSVTLHTAAGRGTSVIIWVPAHRTDHTCLEEGAGHG